MFEFLLVLPFILSLALGIWEVGRILDALLVATNAAREGARFATATGTLDTGAIQDRVVAYLAEGYGPRLGSVSGGTCTSGDVCINKSDIQVVFLDDSGNPVSPGFGYEVQVTVPVKVRVFQSFLPGFADPFTLTGRASMAN